MVCYCVFAGRFLWLALSTLIKRLDDCYKSCSITSGDISSKADCLPASANERTSDAIELAPFGILRQSLATKSVHIQRLAVLEGTCWGAKNQSAIATRTTPPCLRLVFVLSAS